MPHGKGGQIGQFCWPIFYIVVYMDILQVYQLVSVDYVQKNRRL